MTTANAYPIALEIVEPRATLLIPRGRSFHSHTSDLARLVEFAGRLCHRSEDRIEDGTAPEFIARTAGGLGHESIVEHEKLTAHAVMSRAASHQLVRHRLAAYSQESQRYCDYSHPKHGNLLSVICPPKIACVPGGTIVHAEYVPDDNGGADVTYHLVEPPTSIGTMILNDAAGRAFKVWYKALIRGYGAYLWLRDHGIPAEDARYPLSNATKTEIVMTFDLRQWAHVFSVRCTKHAQWEIRGIMQSLLRLFHETMPWYFTGPLLDLLDDATPIAATREI